MSRKQNNNALTLPTVCLFLAYLLPFHFLPFSPFYNDWLTIFAVVILLAYIAPIKLSIASIPWIAIIPVTLAVIISVQALSGMLTASGDAVLPIAYFIVVAIVIVLGASVAASQGGSAKICMALAGAHLFAGLTSVIIASLQFVGAEAALDPFVMLMLHPVGEVIRPIANIAQPNQLALLFCIAIASAWWLYQAGRVRANIMLCAVLVLLWGLALTQSRIGWLIVPTFAIFVWLSLNKAGLKKVPNGWMIGLVLIYIAFVVALPIIAREFGAAAITVAERVGQRSDRLVLLQQALRISLSNPWFGAGWYEFGPQQLKMAADFAPAGYSQHAHNIVMNFAAELGWPITIVIFGIIIYWLFNCCFRRPISKEVGFATLVFIAVLIHSMVEYPLWYAYVLVPVAFLIGLVHEEQMGSQKIKLHRIFVISVIFFILSGLVAAATDYRRLVSGMWVTGWTSLGVKMDIWGIEKPNLTIFPHFYDYFRAQKIAVREGMPREEIALMEQVTKRFGFLDVLERLSLSYTLNNRPDDAIKTLIMISKLHEYQYPAVYKSWKNLANREPAKFAYVFQQMPKP